MIVESDVIRRQTRLDASRFVLSSGTPGMMAAVTTGVGGPEMLEYREVPMPRPAAGEVLLEVLAAGVNATEINTRIGWYSDTVTLGTEGTAQGAGGSATASGWDAPTPFPLIQGTDCCGRVVAVGPAGDAGLVGRRALIRPCMRPGGFSSMQTVWMGSDFDGAFAHFVKAPASEVFVVESDWSDVELASVPCACGTAENMLRRAHVRKGETVLVIGASGGVGSALVQCAKRRGAIVAAVTRHDKAAAVLALGADRCCGRDDVVGCLGEESVDVVADNVSGPSLGTMLAVLKRGGRYVSSGAIAGPLISFDKRILYLKDLTLIGCTAWDAPVFPDVIAAVERGEIRPVVAGVFPLAQIAAAQQEFLTARHVGKLVLVP